MHLRDLIQPDLGWLDSPSLGRVAWVSLAAIGGLAAYGFTVGFWRDPLMGGYVAVKMPLLIFLTLLCNGLLNGLLALLLGSGLGFRQSLLALLSSSAIAGVILGSLAPVTLLMAMNAPPPGSPQAHSAHAAYLISHTFLIGFAGIVANVHLHRLLAVKATTSAAATATLLAWLAGNGFLGAQFSWVLRPFFGSPQLEVQFLRPDPLRGNFYQTVWHILQKLSDGFALPILTLMLMAMALPVFLAIQSNHQPRKS